MNEAENYSLRLKPYYRNLGMIHLLFVLCVWIGSAIGIYFDVDDSGERLYLRIALFSFLSVICSLLLIPGLFQLLLSHRFRLSLDKSRVIQTGIWRTREISFADISKLKWQNISQNGDAVLTSAECTIHIDFSDFLPYQKRTDMMTFLHENVLQERQENWDAFHEDFVVRSQEKILQQQHSLKRMWFLCLSGAVLVFATIGLTGISHLFLWLSIFPLSIITWLMFKDRKKGIVK